MDVHSLGRRGVPGCILRFARDADPKKPYGDTAAFQSNIPESVGTLSDRSTKAVAASIVSF